MTLLRSLLLIIVLFSSCAYARVGFHEVREDLKRVDRSDGIDRFEAIILAQNFLIDKALSDRLYTLKPFDVQKKFIAMRDGKEIELLSAPRSDFRLPVKKIWLVLFRDKEGSQLFGHYPVIPFYVAVNQDSGEIQGWGLKRD